MIAFTPTRHAPGMDCGVGWNKPLGIVPTFFWQSDPRPAREQIDERYAHGGGFRPHPGGFTVRGDFDALVYPGSPEDGEPDEIYPALAEARLRDERIIYFHCSWLAIVQPDGSFEVSRVD